MIHGHLNVKFLSVLQFLWFSLNFFIPFVHFAILSYRISPVSVPICSFDNTQQ